MPVLGINLEKNGFRYTLLEGTKDAPKFIEKQKVAINAASDISELMDWYETTFQNLVSKYNPSIIGIKLSLDAKKASIPYWYYPYGVLHNISYKKKIEIFEFVPANFTPSKFGFKKSINLYNHIDDVMGVHKPHWDKSQKYSVLAAWMVL
ncbi:MAG TPA: hypothetical protein DEO36_04205 [Flavobacteriaceae bacterium]|jgi:hypothetical protein|nr:hypothetical protein [Flavobacteriaceae bacterium]